MDDRPTVPLIELCDPKRGITYGIVKVGDYVEGGVPVIRGGDIRDDRIVFSDEKRVTEGVSHQHRRTILTGGEIVINLISEPGHSAIVPPEMAGFNVSRDVAVIALNDRANHSYLNWFLKSPVAVEWLTARLSGSVTQKINLGSLRDLPIRLPSRGDQDAIAEVLGALDDKVAANDHTVSTADELAEAQTLASLESGVEVLSEVAEVTMGSSPPGASYNETAEGVVFYQGVRDFGVRFPANRVWTTAPARLALPGDTLVSVRAPVGRTNLANERLCIGRGIAALRSRAGIPMTLFHQVRAAHSVWAPYEAEGTVFGSINKHQLESIPLPRIRIDRRDELETLLTALEDQISAALQESADLARVRDELLPLLMSGKVRVKDAEKVVEEVV